MTQRAYRLPPPYVTGYPLDARLAVVAPSTANITNAVANPSIETNTTGYTAIGGTVAQSIAKQRRGAYSLLVTPGSGTADGAYYGTVGTVAGRAYPWSFDFWGEAGREYLAYWASTVAARVSASVLIVGKGRWQRVQVPYVETATTTRRLYIVKNGSANVRPFYIDGMLVPAEANDVEEWRYFDGDSRGFVAAQTDFYWNGTPHGSTSTMKSNTRAGGRIMDLARYGLVVQMMAGLGMSTPNNVALPLALPGGEQYQDTLAPASDFRLTGYVEGRSLPDLQEKQGQIKALLDVRRQPDRQTLLLQYQPVNDCGDVIGETAEVRCSFAGGLEGTWDNHTRVNLDLRFRVHLPYIAVVAGTQGAALDVRDSFTAGYVARRSVDGIWGALNTSGLNGDVNAALPLSDGRWLLGGSFTNAGGFADADYLVYYDPATDTFAAVNATPLNERVNVLLQLPDGNVLAGGNFTNAGGAGDADYLTLVTLATGAYSALNATPLNAAVIALALLPTGNVAVGGSFTNAGGAGDADYLCLLTIATGAYSAFNATPLSALVLALAVAPDGYLYLGGAFTNAGGNASADYVARMSGPSYGAYSALTPDPGGPILNNSVRAILPTSDGRVLLGGDFTAVAGVANWGYLVAYNGVGFEAPFLDINGIVYELAEAAPGVNLVGGAFTSVVNAPLFDRLFQYSGSTIIPLDLDWPGSPQIASLGVRAPTGELIVGGNTTGTAYTSGTTTITNTGTAPSKPIIVISHPTTATLTAPLYSIRNLTSGKVISFNLTLLIGETLTIDFAAGSVMSNLRGNLISTVLPGSNMATFELVPGPNAINIFSSLASGSLPTAYTYWTPALAGVADAN